MPAYTPRKFKRVLDPMERISEVLFGLIMVLTITSSMSVFQAGHEDIRTMLYGALGCNLAWGIIDGVFYLLACLSERGHNIRTLHAIRNTADPVEAHRIISEGMPPLFASLSSPQELEAIRQKLVQLPAPPNRLWFDKDDWLGAIAVFLLVMLTTFPVTIPFIVFKEAYLALHISNFVGIIMLFLTGYAFGHHVGRYPWRTGVVMMILGMVLVGITKALGG